MAWSDNSQVCPLVVCSVKIEMPCIMLWVVYCLYVYIWLTVFLKSNIMFFKRFSIHLVNGLQFYIRMHSTPKLNDTHTHMKHCKRYMLYDLVTREVERSFGSVGRSCVVAGLFFFSFLCCCCCCRFFFCVQRVFLLPSSHVYSFYNIIVGRKQFQCALWKRKTFYSDIVMVCSLDHRMYDNDSIYFWGQHNRRLDCAIGYACIDDRWYSMYVYSYILICFHSTVCSYVDRFILYTFWLCVFFWLFYA